MRTRLAKARDVDELVRVHWAAACEQPGGFLYRLGKGYLRQYYHVVLKEKNSVVLCAEDDRDRIIGLVSGTLDAEEHRAALQRSRFRLGWAAAPALLRDASLLGGLVSRMKSIRSEQPDAPYVFMSGAREEYWAWDPTRRSGEALELQRRWLQLMRTLGATSVSFEVDRVNDKVVRIHRILGAIEVREFITPDGNERLLMQYSFEQPSPRR